jgi:hypothetical protein
MKKSIRLSFLVSSILCLCSCHKTAPTPTYSSSFNFKANNIAYNWEYNSIGPARSAIILKNTDPISLNTIYLLQGMDSLEKITVNCHINTSTLTLGTYKIVTTPATAIIRSSYLLNNVTYAPIVLNDSVEVIITNITNNYASGTFKAVMHDVSTTLSKLEIMEGNFSHVIISN